jgi:hypothetical protein
MSNEKLADALASLMNINKHEFPGDMDRARVDVAEPTCFTVTVDGRRRRVEVIYA